MASVGFSAAYGNQAMADAVRQRMIDELSQAKDAHTMRLQDAELALKQQEADQNAQDRALLRKQQGQGFNEKLAEGLGTNLGPGQTIISPELAQRFQNTTLAPLVKPDATLPSTQISSGMIAPGGGSGYADNGTPNKDLSTALSVTQQAPQLTGQLRFMGTPAQNDIQNQRTLNVNMVGDKATPSSVRGFLRANPEAKGVPYELYKDSADPLEQVATPNGPQYVPRSQAIGKTPYHVPPQPPASIVVQTDAGPGLVNPRSPNPTITPITNTNGEQVKGKTGQTVEGRLQSAQAVTQTGNDIIKALSDPNVAAKLGPAMSRYNTVADFVGNPPPEFSNLAGLIESYSLANMGVHGMRSNTGAEAIKNTLGLNRHTPASMIATIQGLNGFANHFMQNNGVMPEASHDVGPTQPAQSGWKVLPR